MDTVHKNEHDEWTDITNIDNNYITMYTKQVSTDNAHTLYQSILTIQSVRTLNAGYCYDDNDDNIPIFKPGNGYQIRFKLMDVYSNILLITTNALPSGGLCMIQGSLEPLQEFSLYCTDWKNHANLVYNALLQNTIMNKKRSNGIYIFLFLIFYWKGKFLYKKTHTGYIVSFDSNSMCKIDNTLTRF